MAGFLLGYPYICLGKWAIELAEMNPFYLASSLLILVLTLIAKYRNGVLYLVAFGFWLCSAFATELLDSNWINGWTSAGYVLFYPIIFAAIPNLFEINQSTEIIRLIDGAILVLGTSTLASALLFRRVRADFLHILYPICDLILLIAVLIAFARRPINARSFLILTGFLIFSTTDFLYLWQNTNEIYQSNSLLDYGWLLGFGLITFALYRRGIKSEAFPPIPIFYIAISVISSALMLAAIAANIFDIPNFIIGPALATLFTAFIRMAIALKQSERVLIQESLARIDDLTGLPNRRKFLNSIEDYLNGSILLMDLDGFKPVNDQFGHEIGDQLLKIISNRFQKAIPNDALLARLGGDEFAVLIHDDYESALELAMAIRATLSYPCLIDGKQIKVDVSIGCVTNDGRPDLMSRADTAMYQAKRAGVGVWAQET